MNNKKYELTDETKETRGRVVYRIRALKDFGNVKVGELGGWVEGEENLSQEGNCWIYNNAEVYGDAEVFGNVKVYDNACIYGNARVFGRAEVFGNASVCGNAKVCGNACIYGNAVVFGDAWVCGIADVFGDARVYENAKVYNNAKVCGNARVYGNAELYRNAELFGNNKLTGKLISKVDEYIEIKNPQGRLVTCVLKNGNILYNVGCQEEISKEEFIDRIYNTNGGIELNPHRENYLDIIDMSELYFKRRMRGRENE